MGPIWVLSAPDGPHVGPMNLAIRNVVLLVGYGVGRGHWMHWKLEHLIRCTEIRYDMIYQYFDMSVYLREIRKLMLFWFYSNITSRECIKFPDSFVRVSLVVVVTEINFRWWDYQAKPIALDTLNKCFEFNYVLFKCFIHDYCLTVQTDRFIIK